MHKFWNFVSKDDNTADLNLYGEIMSEEPWFSEDYVTYRLFVQELNALGTRDTINVHINSGGGDVFAAHAIFTNLKLNKAKIIAFIEGVCASAATIVASAADIIKAAPNAVIMYHNNKVGLSGYYDTAELEKLAEINKEIKQSIIEAYKTKMNKTDEEINLLMEEETWMTGKKAVEEGYADELLFNEVSSVMKGSVVFVNNVSIDTSKFKNFPTKLLNKTPDGGFIDKSNNPMKGKDDEMEIKTVDELKKAYPDFVNQIIASAKEEGAVEERSRIQEIDKLTGMVPVDAMNKAKYEEPTTSKDLAYQAIIASKDKGSKLFDDIKNDLGGSGADDVTGNGIPGSEEEQAKSKVMNLAGFLNKDARRAK